MSIIIVIDGGGVLHDGYRDHLINLEHVAASQNSTFLVIIKASSTL